uniref:Protein kinase domain-containing protein n=1 Tax=Panagrolaimus sp. ES5 TaxID=591445 RepID=A0AC34FVM4_9BILA
MEDDESDSDPTFNASDFAESDDSEYDKKKPKKLIKRKKKKKQQKKRISAKSPEIITLEDRSPPASNITEEKTQSPQSLSVEKTQEGDETISNGKESGENGQSTTLQQQLQLLKINNPGEAEIIQKPEDGEQKTKKVVRKVRQFQTTRENPLDVIGFQFQTKTHNYTITKMIGSGSFGNVYEVKNENEELFGMKTCKSGTGALGLAEDCRILKLVEPIKSPHFCDFVECGHLEGKFFYVVMTLVGMTVYKAVKDGVSLATKIILCKQTFCAARDLHKIGHVHCDLKSNNVTIGNIGTSDPNCVYLIDFGLVKTIQEDGNKALRERPKFDRYPGHHKYSSISSLEGLWPSRNDDIESIYYCCLIWIGFDVPWSDACMPEDNLKLKKEFWNNAKETIQELKKNLPREVPEAFVQIYSLINGKKWGEMPEYDKISEILETAFQELTKSQLHKLEWMANEPYQEPKKSEYGEINPRYRIPYFQHSRKKDGHYNVIVKGEVYNYKAHLKKEREGKIVARYKCKNHHRCNRTLLVGNYKKDEIQNDDEAEIKREKGREDKPHACELKENGTSEETAWGLEFFNS